MKTTVDVEGIGQISVVTVNFPPYPARPDENSYAYCGFESSVTLPDGCTYGNGPEDVGETPAQLHEAVVAHAIETVLDRNSGEYFSGVWAERADQALENLSRVISAVYPAATMLTLSWRLPNQEYTIERPVTRQWLRDIVEDVRESARRGHLKTVENDREENQPEGEQ
jgi:hypothetical protein